MYTPFQSKLRVGVFSGVGTQSCPPKFWSPGSNWGGTIIQSWSDNATNAKCVSLDDTEPARLQLPVGVEAPEAFAADSSSPSDAGRGAQPGPNDGHGVLFNAMINPYAVGPVQSQIRAPLFAARTLHAIR